MGFSLFFWRKPQSDEKGLREPEQPRGLQTLAMPSMPFVRDETVAPHPRLQRMAEALQRLPEAGSLENPSLQNPALPHLDAPVAPLAVPARMAQAPAVPAVSVEPVDEPLPESPAMPASHGFEHGLEMRIEEPMMPAHESAIVTIEPLAAPAPRSETLPPPLPPMTRLDEQVQNLASNLAAEFTSAPQAAVDPTPIPDFYQRATSPFYAQDNSVFWTVADLGDALVQMHPDTFAHHVNTQRNDFANWIQGCFSGETVDFGHELRLLKPTQEQFIRCFVSARHSAMHAPEPRRPQFDDKMPAPPQMPAWTQNAPAKTSFIPAPPAAAPEVSFESTPAPVAVPPQPRNPVQELIERLNTAQIQALDDIGAAREEFITIRGHVWQHLTEEERRQVFPKLRETYEKLRSM